jgi:hypothetical protein
MRLPVSRALQLCPSIGWYGVAQPIQLLCDSGAVPAFRVDDIAKGPDVAKVYKDGGIGRLGFVFVLKRIELARSDTCHGALPR